MVATCPSDNTVAVDQETFWNGNWDAHKIGWIISGAAAAVTLGISLITIVGHGRNYHRPNQQRQIIRILLFAPVFAIISFFSYRFFRDYTYYELIEIVWEAVAIAAFLILILNYIGEDEGQQRNVLAKKDKKKLPLPFCCFRYRPSKAYYLVIIKWGVVQYCFVRPALSIAGIVLQYYNLLCESSLSYRYGYVYILAVDFASISVALYALIVLYALIREDLRGRRPLAKFLSVKAAIFLTFYQSFIFSFLQDKGVIKATEYWTATNVSDGLNALCTSLEMVLVAAFQVWAFDWKEYKEIGRQMAMDQSDGLDPKKVKAKHTNPLYALLHALWPGDLFMELWHSMRFAFDRMRGKEYTRHDARFNAGDIVAAFGADGRHDNDDNGAGAWGVQQLSSSKNDFGMTTSATPRNEMQQLPESTQPYQNFASRDALYREDTLVDQHKYNDGAPLTPGGKSQIYNRSAFGSSRSSTSLTSDHQRQMEPQQAPPLPSGAAAAAAQHYQYPQRPDHIHTHAPSQTSAQDYYLPPAANTRTARYDQGPYPQGVPSESGNGRYLATRQRKESYEHSTNAHAGLHQPQPQQLQTPVSAQGHPYAAYQPAARDYQQGYSSRTSREWASGGLSHAQSQGQDQEQSQVYGHAYSPGYDQSLPAGQMGSWSGQAYLSTGYQQGDYPQQQQQQQHGQQLRPVQPQQPWHNEQYPPGRETPDRPLSWEPQAL